ncbi:MAG: hypothetical protein HY892_20735 [Deltaproteobacteria bacterium]|nr:hypothetical protein [Deltaproteobacteria bacterium]
MTGGPGQTRGCPLRKKIAGQKTRMNSRCAVFCLLALAVLGFTAPLAVADTGPGLKRSPWQDIRSYGTLPAALAAIGPAPATLLISDRQTITTDTTIPAHITLHFLQGGVLAIGDGVRVSLNGPVQAGAFRIFDLASTGVVLFNAGSVGEAPVEWWGAVGDDRTDNVWALRAAVTSVNETYGNPALILGPGHYRIGGPIVIHKNNLTLRGVGHRISKLKCTAAEAGLVLDKGSRQVLYSTRLEEFEVDGNSLARLGLDLVNTSETTFRGVSVRGCGTGIRLGGAVSPSQCTFTECVVADSRTGVKFIHAVNPIFDKGNFWNNTTVFDFDTAYAPIFTNNWIEKFTTAFLFSHLQSKGAGVAVPTLVIRNNYFLSTDGGRTFDCRVLKAVGDNGGQTVNIGPVVFEGNHLHLTAARYIAEIAWGRLFAAGNRLLLKMKENHLFAGVNTRAWFKADVPAEPERSPVHLIFQDNAYPAGTTIQEGAGALVTGVGAQGPDWGTANRVLGAEVQGPVLTWAANDRTPSVKLGNVFKTANTVPTAIKDFREGQAGQKITVIIGDAHTAVGFQGTSLKGNGGKDWKAGNGDWLECLYDGTQWYCSVHRTAP